jgi:predicted nucleotidyltransferase/uncharacterized protein (UPF0332 family)
MDNTKLKIEPKKEEKSKNPYDALEKKLKSIHLTAKPAGIKKHKPLIIHKKPKSHKANAPISGTKNAKTLNIVVERDIALDFAAKTYNKFRELTKAIILFGSSAKQIQTDGSDIDIIILIDDIAVEWDEELISWYREELAKIIQQNPYKRALHINTVKLSTWWEDLLRGDPIVINIIRYGDALVDAGGFFSPLKLMLQNGKIRSTPETIYTLLQRAPSHLARTRISLLSAIDGLYWAMVDSAHAALVSANVLPPSPEHIPQILEEQFVHKKMLDKKYVTWFEQIHAIAKEIIHGKRNEISGKEIDEWIKIADAFVGEMARIINQVLGIRG